MIEKLIEKFISQFDSSPLLPIVLIVFLALYGLGWLLPKSKDVQAWKELFSKDRSEELKKAREDVKDITEEEAFYDEALREELFHTATRTMVR